MIQDRAESVKEEGIGHRHLPHPLTEPRQQAFAERHASQYRAVRQPQYLEKSDGVGVLFIIQGGVWVLQRLLRKERREGRRQEEQEGEE